MIKKIIVFTIAVIFVLNPVFAIVTEYEGLEKITIDYKISDLQITRTGFDESLAIMEIPRQDICEETEYWMFDNCSIIYDSYDIDCDSIIKQITDSTLLLYIYDMNDYLDDEEDIESIKAEFTIMNPMTIDSNRAVIMCDIDKDAKTTYLIDSITHVFKSFNIEIDGGEHLIEIYINGKYISGKKVNLDNRALYKLYSDAPQHKFISKEIGWLGFAVGLAGMIFSIIMIPITGKSAIDDFGTTPPESMFYGFAAFLCFLWMIIKPIPFLLSTYLSGGFAAVSASEGSKEESYYEELGKAELIILNQISK